MTAKFIVQEEVEENIQVVPSCLTSLTAAYYGLAAISPLRMMGFIKKYSYAENYL